MSEIYRSAQAETQVRTAYRALLNIWPIPHEELRIPTAAGETFVIACGRPDAPPLVAFHGAQANAATWMFDCIAWARDFRVYLVDVPGDAGFSAPVRPPLGSEAYVDWLDELFAALKIQTVRLVGVSLGGWLALDYATRRPERVERLAVLCPAGVGAQKNLLLKAAPLLFLGAWGRRRLAEMVFGPVRDDIPEAARPLIMFLGLVTGSTRARPTAIPIFPDDALARLTMPLLAIVGGRDALLDSDGTRQRLAALCPKARVVYLPDGYHVLPGQAETIAAFLGEAA
jgi:pimeloyl-ACP methyl ester carboxylesterase